MLRGRAVLPAAALLVAVFGAASCAKDLDTSRQPRPASTLGEDVFSVVCDRIGASSLSEDLEGASYHAVCHKSASGAWGDSVDQARLSPSASEARRLGVAKVEAMARRRTQLVQAFDALFPDVRIDDPRYPGDEGRQVRLHDALAELTRGLAPLYDGNPFAGADPSNAAPLVPSSSRALGRMFDAIASSPDAVAALSRIGGRVGYRPLHVGLGAIRPALAYPGLRPLAQQALSLVGPGGDAEAELSALLDVTEEELRIDAPDAPVQPFRIQDPARLQPNRPRTDLELVSTLLLAEDAAFALPDATPRYISARDTRGYVLPYGLAPATAGAILPPFVDLDGDGMADVDAFGRFVDGSQAPLAIDLPFDVPGTSRILGPDPFGRALDGNGKLLFSYVDTSRTFTGSLSRDLLALVDPVPADSHETLMNTLAGALVLYGDQVSASRTDPYALDYQGFDPDTSPLVDLVYALGQLLGEKGSDDYLAQLGDLADHHQPEVARLLGDALAIHATAVDPQKPLNAAAQLSAQSVIWDEMADLVARIAEVGPDAKNPRGLLDDLVLALADDRTLGLGQAFSKFTRFRDRMSYDPSNINGPLLNLESLDHQPPHVDVSRTSPPSDAPDNRSDFQKFVQIIHDANGVHACNKAGAVVHAKLGPISLDYPLPLSPPLAECGLFSFDSLGVLYIQSIVGKAHLTVNDQTLNALVGAVQALTLGSVTADDIFVQSSGITGLSLTSPSPGALNRLVFFGAEAPKYGAVGDLDPFWNGANAKTNAFVRDLVDPVPTRICPVSGPNQTQSCADFKDTFRGRDPATIFLWEEFGFYEGMAPLVDAFVRHGQEQLFIDLVEVVYRHWASPAHGPECQKSGTPASNPAYCSEDGAVAYEPILVDAYASDLLPALHDFTKMLISQQIVSARVPGQTRDGVAVLADLVRVLFDPAHAASIGLTDRFGSAGTLWCDGTTAKPQTTPFDLFANALARMDQRFASAQDYADLDARKALWKSARSQLVDQFLQIDGAATSSTFHNQAVPKALPILLRAIREQVNAHCPDRETGAPCAWATHDLAAHASDSVGGPVLAAVVRLTEKIRGNDAARAELEKLLTYLLSEASDSDALQATLASMSDIFQILRDDPEMAPIFSAVSNAAAPATAVQAGAPAPGLASTTIKLLAALTDASDSYDRFRVLDPVLKNLVTPMDPAAPSLTPLEVLIDTIAEVNRIDASAADAALTPDDYRTISGSVRDFLTSPTRGLEQMYTIVHHRDGQ